MKTKKGRVPKGEEVILTRVQQSIIKSWPDEEDFYEATEEEVFADLHSRLDHMLSLCGFAEIELCIDYKSWETVFEIPALTCILSNGTFIVRKRTKEVLAQYRSYDLETLIAWGQEELQPIKQQMQ